MKYRASLRGFDLAKIEEIVRHSAERYFDTETGRRVVIGRYDRILVMIEWHGLKQKVVVETPVITTFRSIIARARLGN